MGRSRVRRPRAIDGDIRQPVGIVEEAEILHAGGCPGHFCRQVSCVSYSSVCVCVCVGTGVFRLFLLYLLSVLSCPFLWSGDLIWLHQRIGFFYCIIYYIVLYYMIVLLLFFSISHVEPVGIGLACGLLAAGRDDRPTLCLSR